MRRPSSDQPNISAAIGPAARGVFPRALSTFCITERSGCKVKGLTLAADADVYAGPRRGSLAPPDSDPQTAMAKTPKNPLKPETRLVNAGRDPQGQHGFVNPPVYHASTVLYPTAEDQVAHRARYQYGRRGTPTSEALENALTRARGRRLAPASPCCRPAWRRFRPRCSRSPAPATISWSPTASIGRPAISARACSSAWASRPPITIR